MASRFQVDEALWAEIAPLIPIKERRRRYPGRRPRDDRQALNGILYVLNTGIAWRDLPQELGYGSGVTCWRRLRDWQEAGVWDRLHQALLDRLGEADRIDWSRASLDCASVPAKRGASSPAPTRRIGENRARSAMVWATGPASRSPRS
jgi:transposase